MSEDDELGVFTWAVERNVADGDGNLFGGIAEGDDSLRILGTDYEQLAKFPFASEGSPWHGYPIQWLGTLAAGRQGWCSTSW